MSGSDILVWSDDSFLRWSDFKAESNPAAFEDSHSFIKYQYTWTVDSEEMGERILFRIENIQLSVEFHPVLSWVRHSQANNDLLRHEQGHYDLAELVKRENIKELRVKFHEKIFPVTGENEEQQRQFARYDSGIMIAKEVERIGDIFSQRRQEYDIQTNFGQDSERQSEYDSVFNSLRR